jgi:hypothetical protein
VGTRIEKLELVVGYLNKWKNIPYYIATLEIISEEYKVLVKNKITYQF